MKTCHLYQALINVLQAHSLFYASQSTFHPNHQQSSQQPNGPHPFARSHGHHHQPHTILSVLRADENAILQRKANIRRFGAGWLRPPGVPKTLQGMADERAEREEQESAANREFALAEAQAAAEAEALEREQEGMAMGGGEQQLERNLDDDVPDADEDDDAGEDWIDDEQEMDEEGMPDMEEEGDGDYAEAGRDLDEDVPEAGSYQHTDTDLEDESSEEDEMPPATFREVGNTGGGGVLGASVFGSSPAIRIPRGTRRSGSGGHRREN